MHKKLKKKNLSISISVTYRSTSKSAWKIFIPLWATHYFRFYCSTLWKMSWTKLNVLHYLPQNNGGFSHVNILVIKVLKGFWYLSLISQSCIHAIYTLSSNGLNSDHQTELTPKLVSQRIIISVFNIWFK